MIKRNYILVAACALAIAFNLTVSSYIQGGTLLHGIFLLFTPYFIFALAIFYYSLKQANALSFLKSFLQCVLFLAIYHFAFKIVWLELGANLRGASVSGTVYFGLFMFYLVSVAVVALLVYVARLWAKGHITTPTS